VSPIATRPSEAGRRVDTSNLRLLLSFYPARHNRERLEVSAEPVRIETDEFGAHVRNLSDSGIRPHSFGGLRIRCCVIRTEQGPETYDWSACYRDCLEIDLPRATQMRATLARIDRQAERLKAEFGPPETFGAYLARAASALRLTCFGYRVGASTHSHDTNTYHWTDAAGMMAEVQHQIAVWRA
jgi:hypothetical protein